MMKPLQIAIIASTLFGTLFVWFDTERISDVIRVGRLNLTDDKKWQAWRYNKAELGFKLLFIGIVLQAVSLVVSECR